MTTITLKIDERKKEAKAFLAYVRTLGFVEEVKEKPRYNEETEQAIRDVRAGKVIKTESHDDLMEKLRS